jgi:hypothetical protein
VVIPLPSLLLVFACYFYQEVKLIPDSIQATVWPGQRVRGWLSALGKRCRKVRQISLLPAKLNALFELLGGRRAL